MMNNARAARLAYPVFSTLARRPTALTQLAAFDIAKIAANADHPERLLKRITVSSTWGPTVMINDPFGPSTGKLDRFGKLMHPKVVLDVDGFDQIRYAPYGEPGSNWPIVKTAGAVVGGLLLLLAGYGTYRLVRG